MSEVEGDRFGLWNAKEYHKNSLPQSVAANHLLLHLPLKQNIRILDVGCGDGKITKKIADLAPSSAVMGLDRSSSMIAFANKMFSKRQQNNLKFQIGDAEQLAYRNEFDIIFSSFALQWLPTPSRFFEGAYTALKKDGCLVATIPLGIGDKLQEAILETTADNKWSQYFDLFSPNWHFQTAETYFSLLSDYGFRKKFFVKTNQKFKFSTRKDFEDYISQWLPHLHALQGEMKKIFLYEIVSRYLKFYSCTEVHEIGFSFERIDFFYWKHDFSSSRE